MQRITTSSLAYENQAFAGHVAFASVLCMLWASIAGPSAAVAGAPAQAVDPRLTAYSVSCENQRDCPAFIAQVIAKDTDGGLTACTGFLLSPDTLMTASQCIPADLKSAGSNCTNRIVFNFPASGRFPAESAGCLEVTKASVLKGASSIDYAMVRLSRPVSRNHVTASQEGVPDGSFYRVAMVDTHSGGGQKATLRMVTCEAIQNTELLLNFDNPRAEQIYLDDCSIGSGSAGAPALKPGEDTAVAIVQSAVRRFDELAPSLREAVSKKRGAVYASNLSCIPDVSASGMTNCQPGRPDLSGNLPEDEQNRLLREQSVNIYTELAKASNVIGWKVADLPNNQRTDKEGRRYHRAATPNCIQPAQYWADTQGFNFGTTGTIFKGVTASADRVTLKFDNLIWAFRPVLSQRLRFTYEPVVFPYQDFTVTLTAGPGGWDGSPVTVNGRNYAMKECGEERQPPGLMAMVRRLTGNDTTLATAQAVTPPAPPTAPAAAKSGDATLAEITSLYRANRAEEALDRARNQLRSNPADFRLRAVTVLLLLKLDRVDDAQKEHQTLAGFSDPAAKPFANQVQSALDARLGQIAMLDKISEALRRLQSADARASIANAGLTPDTANILLSYLDLYEGNFSSAVARAAQIKEPNARTAVLQQIRESEQSFTNDVRTVRFITIPDSESAEDIPWMPEFRALRGPARHDYESEVKSSQKAGQFLMGQFADAASRLQQRTPLHPDALYGILMATLAFRPYEEFEALADAVLGSSGSLTFHTVGEYGFNHLTVTLTSATRTIALSTATGKIEKKYPAFSILFDQVKELSHLFKVDAYKGSAFVTDAELRLSPRGRFRMPAGLAWLDEAYGPDAYADVSRKLGKYVAHAINSPTLKYKPLEVKLNTGSTLMRLLNVTGQALAESQGDSQRAAFFGAQVEESLQHAANANAAYSASLAWSDKFRSDARVVLNTQSFSEIDQLLDQLR